MHHRTAVRERRPLRGRALIAERTPGDLNKVFFTNGGADANEHAVRMARLHTGRYKVLSRYRSYHGGTDTAINLTGDPRRWPNDYGNSGVVHFHGPFLYRSQFHSENEQQETERALEHLDQLIRLEGPTSIAAIVLESVPGTAGIMVPPPGYMAGVREICDRYGIVFIADEVMSGFGRTGKWFAIDHFGVVPDLITFAKGVNSGYVPLGGVAISEKIAATSPTGRTPEGSPIRDIRSPLQPPSRRSTRWRTRGSSRTRPGSAARSSVPDCVALPTGTRRSVKSADSACSGRSNSSPTVPRRNRSLRTAPPVRR